MKTSRGERDGRTVHPDVLLGRGVFKQQPAGRLEDEVSEEGCQPLVLGAQRVFIARVERRALGDVRGVVLEERGQVAVGYAREEEWLDECCELIVGPTGIYTPSLSIRLAAGDQHDLRDIQRRQGEDGSFIVTVLMAKRSDMELPDDTGCETSYAPHLRRAR